MKPIQLLIGLLSLAYASINLNAQSPSDTVKVSYKGKNYKVSPKRDPEEQERSTTWKILDTVKGEMVLIRVISKTDDGKSWDKESSATYKDSGKRQYHLFKEKLANKEKFIKTYFVPTIELGFLSSMNENSNDDKLEPTVGKSTFSSLNLIRQTMNLSHNKFFLSYGLNFNRNTIRYSNKQQVQYLDNNGYIQTAIDTINTYKRNNFSVNYIAIPLLLEYHSKSDKFKIAAGAEFGFNGKSSIYQKGTRKEGSFTQTNRYDLKINPTQINALLRIEVHQVAIYARYSVTEMYKTDAYATNTNPNRHLFSVGICLFGI
ncbi:MAG: outer membrane beta-barrel protein [bacterium]|nr:outer membrane beta-barrel protein [bacterium]